VNVQEGDAFGWRARFHQAYCRASPFHKFGDFSNAFVRKLYKDALAGIKKASFLMPVIAFCDVTAHLFRKLKKISLKQNSLFLFDSILIYIL